MNKFKRLRYRFIFKVNFQKGKMKSSPFLVPRYPSSGRKVACLICSSGCCHGGTCSTPLGTDRNPSNSGGLYKQKQRLLPFRNSLRHTICADQSCSGAISLYPFPWMLMISIDGSSFKCLRNLVIYTSILLALK